jgi:hypothetical protein
MGYHGADGSNPGNQHASGRWPANLCIDEQAAAMLDRQSGATISRAGGNRGKTQIWGNAAAEQDRDGFTDSGGASRFYLVVSADCALCRLSIRRHDIMSACENTDVPNAARCSAIIRATIESIARGSVWASEAERLARVVPYAESLCDSCATRIAAVIVGTKPLDFRSAESVRFLASMPESARCILIRSLASCAEALASTDTTRIMGGLWSSCGSALHAIERSTRQGDHGNGNGPDMGTRFRYEAKASRSEREEGLEGKPTRPRFSGGMDGGGSSIPLKGSPIPKVANHHPTVKPVSLMRWLVRLVTPPGGIVLDPFMGSGTTGIAAHEEGCKFVGIEKEREYFDIATQRIDEMTRQEALPL